jgi:hypothetical protein
MNIERNIIDRANFVSGPRTEEARRGREHLRKISNFDERHEGIVTDKL